MTQVDCSKWYNALLAKVFPKWFVCKTTPPAPSEFTATFDHQDSRTDWAGCALLNTALGVFESRYNFNTRVNSELWLNGTKIYTGSQETLGQPLVYNNTVYFPCEGGKSLFYSTGSVKEGVVLRHSSAAIDYKGQPCYISSETDAEWVINAETGAKVLKLDVPAMVGIPFSAIHILNSEEIAVVLLDDESTGSRLVTTSGIIVPVPYAQVVENWQGQILVGAKGIIYSVNLATKIATKWYDTGSGMVNHLWYDSENDLLWVSCSGPDNLSYFDNKGAIHNVVTLPPDSNPAGMYFDGRVTKGWWLRVNSKQATYYKIAKGTPPPTYKYIAGDTKDAGAEIWNPSFNGMDVRLSVDDVSNLNRCGVPAVGSWYSLDASVMPSGSVVLSVDGSGAAVVTAKDFISSRTGMKYHYCGCLVGTSSGQLQTANPLVIPKSSCTGSLRIMTATVEK